MSNGVSAKAGDATQLEADWLAVRRGFDRGDERHFAGGAAPALASAAFAADVGVVELDTTGQGLAGVPLEHDLLELVLGCPGGGLGHAEAAAQLDAGDALLALSEVVDRPELKTQRQLGRGEDRPGGRRDLPTAGAALIKIPRRHEAVLGTAALRTHEAIGPSRHDHRVAALLLGTVAAFELGLAEPFLELDFMRAMPKPLKIINVLDSSSS
jgi:hypothetical protein